MTRWSKSRRIRNHNAPAKPGLYIIFNQKTVQRIRKKDPLGILYIGESKNLAGRLDQFWDANHPASGLLWDHPEIAKNYLGKACASHEDVEALLPGLYVKIFAPVKGGKTERVRLERALLYAYIYRFGEPPPLNSQISGKWEDKPRRTDLNWAKKIIQQVE